MQLRRAWLLIAPMLIALFLYPTVSLAATTESKAPGGAPFTISGLAVTPSVGVFGAIPVGSCNLVTQKGCEAKTFTVKNVGSKTIFIDGFGIANVAANSFGLTFGTVGSGCEFLPVVDGHWALFAGNHCIISVVAAPPTRGPTSNVLKIWFADESSAIATVPLLAIGV